MNATASSKPHEEDAMTPEQVVLVQKSFAEVAPIADEAAALFYGRLFEIAPETRPLFNGDMAEQGRKLMATLAVVVNGLGNLEAILPAASALAKRHAAYGVAPVDYDAVGDALIWTLERGLGPVWNDELAIAWSTAYATLAGYMIDQAYGSPAAA
jgi:nitric oxide dioxygenase